MTQQRGQFEKREQRTIGGEQASALLDRALVILERVCVTEQCTCCDMLCAAVCTTLPQRETALPVQRRDAARTDVSVRHGFERCCAEGMSYTRGPEAEGGGPYTPSVAAFLFLPVAPLLPPAALMHWRSAAFRALVTALPASKQWLVVFSQRVECRKQCLLKPVDYSLIKSFASCVVVNRQCNPTLACMPSAGPAADSELTVPGLPNNGDNLCYLNSAVQALASSRSVHAALQGSLERYSRQTEPTRGLSPQTARPQLLEALADVLQRLQPCTGDERAAISSHGIANALRYALASCKTLKMSLPDGIAIAGCVVDARKL